MLLQLLFRWFLLDALDDIRVEKALFDVLTLLLFKFASSNELYGCQIVLHQVSMETKEPEGQHKEESARYQSHDT